MYREGESNSCVDHHFYPDNPAPLLSLARLRVMFVTPFSSVRFPDIWVIVDTAYVGVGAKERERASER